MNRSFISRSRLCFQFSACVHHVVRLSACIHKIPIRYNSWMNEMGERAGKNNNMKEEQAGVLDLLHVRSWTIWMGEKM